MRRILTGVVCLLFVAGSTAVLKADAIFNFEDLVGGAMTPFTETNNGVTATFTSSVAGAYDIDINPEGIGSGLRLIQTDETAITNPQIIPLTISFGGQQFLSTTFPFALMAVSGANPQLTLQAFLGGTLVGSAIGTTGVDLPPPPDMAFYSTGSLSFNSPSAFDSLVLTSSIPGLAIDDLSVSTSAISGVPEPASIALFMFGLAGILAFVRHRRQRHETA